MKALYSPIQSTDNPLCDGTQTEYTSLGDLMPLALG